MPPSTSVYIVIVTYNGSRWLDKCFPPLFPLPSGWKVVVVDNASSDDCVDEIHKRFPLVHCLKNNSNLGFGKANNIGIQLAVDEGADYVFLLNQDAWITIQGIASLVAVQQKHPEFAIVSPIHLTGDASRMDPGFETYCCQPPSNSLLSDLVLHKELHTIYETCFVNAAAWLVSRDCLLSVGGFDPLFFHYGEDVDYTRRVALQGKKIGIVPSVFACHDRDGRTSAAERALADIGSCLLSATNSRKGKTILYLRMWRLMLRACKQFILLRTEEVRHTIKSIDLLWRCVGRLATPRDSHLGVAFPPEASLLSVRDAKHGGPRHEKEQVH